MLLRCRDHELDLGTSVAMGVLNVTPDSFSDGGRYDRPDAALAHGLDMVAAGARLIDVGGESTRPGAQPVSAAEEIRRVVPVISALVARTAVPISIDTSKPEVMQAALEAGASFVNDVNAFRAPGALELVAGSGAGVCLMHMLGEPGTMQSNPQYGDVVAEVRDFLQARVAACVAAGMAEERIVIDPGIGFGKRVEHNLALLAGLEVLVACGLPVLVGVSRKSLIGAITGHPTADRLAGGIAFAALAVRAGAAIVRTHDVAPTVDAIRVAQAVRRTAQREAGRE
jgi:dihydropteroate synthase